MQAVDDAYIQAVIKRGKQGSDLLAALAAPTLRNNSHVVIIGDQDKRAALQIPEGCNVIVHSDGVSDAEYSSVGQAASHLVESLVNQSLQIGATPVAITDDINSRTGDLDMLREIMTSLATTSTTNRVAIINGENAILGDVIPKKAHTSATMISIIPKDAKVFGRRLPEEGVFYEKGEGKTVYATFSADGKYVIANSDGIGTKTRFYQRLFALTEDPRAWSRSLDDFLAMILDDGAKVRGARVKSASGVFEATRFDARADALEEYMQKRAEELGILITLQRRPAHLNSFAEGEDAYNIGGTAVGIVSEEDLQYPLTPVSGEVVVAIRGKPNPRSNGITSKREAMRNLLGDNWHQTPMGKMFLEFLAEPSTVLYPAFHELIELRLATSVYHMSGGAYKGKFADQLAKHNLFANLDNLFAPDWREIAIVEATATSLEAAYGKFPMGNEGLFTTENYDTAERARLLLERRGLESKPAGIIHSKNEEGFTLRAYNGKTVVIDGK